MPVKSTEARLRKTVAVMALSLGLAAQGGWIQPAFAQGAPDADAAVQFRGLPDAEPAAAALGVADMAGLLAKSTASAAEIKDAQTALDGVMTLTGLPQNFTLVLADVPRISAVILPDDNGIPRRVLVVPQERTGNLAQARAAQDWPLLAALAHEVSHHLMGHSLLAGASMPVEEREADRNAGFLLERMGADLPAAMAAIDAANAGDPAKRLAALPQLEELAAGWIQACGEDGGCIQPVPVAVESGAIAARPQPRPDRGEGASPDLSRHAAEAADAALALLREKLQTQLKPANAGAEAATLVAHGAPQPAGAQHTVSANGSHGRSGYRLPLPDPHAVPVKFERFVYDPMGLVNEKEIASLARDAFAYAQKPGVEIVTIVTDSLHGLSPEAYAQIMLRQLQVGQQDLGNGALIVIAPNEGRSAVALGAGVISAITAAPSAGSPTSGDEAIATMRNRAAAFVEGLKQGSDPKVPTVAMALTEAAHAVMRSPDIANAEWFIRYGSLQAALAAQEADWSARAKSGAGYDPAKDPVGRRILSLRAEVSGALDPEAAARIDPEQLRLYGSAIAVRDTAGEAYTLFVPPVATSVAQGPLVAGRSYQIVARVVENGGEKPMLALMSYDDLTPLP